MEAHQLFFEQKLKKKVQAKDISSTNGTYRNSTAIVNEFIDYFTVNNKPLSDSFSATLERQALSFFLYPTILERIENGIKQLKPRSAGLDSIQRVHLKYVTDITADPFSLVINLLFENGGFPPELKRNKIVPVF